MLDIEKVICFILDHVCLNSNENFVQKKGCKPIWLSMLHTVITRNLRLFLAISIILVRIFLPMICLHLTPLDCICSIVPNNLYRAYMEARACPLRNHVSRKTLIDEIPHLIQYLMLKHQKIKYIAEVYMNP